MRRAIVVSLLVLLSYSLPVVSWAQKRVSEYVDPFIGTANYGATHPGALRPHGLMSVVPFNVMGSATNRFDKDSRWWSTPYDHRNVYCTGYSHVNLSGVGCPDLGALLLMPTAGELQLDYRKYGSPYDRERASVGYYTHHLTKYDITSELTATLRTGVSRFTYHQGGRSHLILNLGEGLTNESGAIVRRVNHCEVEGSKLMGNFCYQPQAVFPLYFVLRVEARQPEAQVWKRQRPMTGIEAEWDKDQGTYKLYHDYAKELAGDEVGALFSFSTTPGEQVVVRLGVSAVSIANARENLEREASGRHFDLLHQEAVDEWERLLSRIEVEGGSEEQRTIFYTALYHSLIHPNILNDINGEYPEMEGNTILKTGEGDTRYTLFSLWDTYRNLHQLLTLVYPEVQSGMLRSLVDMYRESGWLPRWELFGRETLTMQGDPAIPVLVDSWLKGLRDFDVNEAYEAMRKSVTAAGGKHPLRPHNDVYQRLGYIPYTYTNDNSVAEALELFVADRAFSRLAGALGHKRDSLLFARRAQGYRHYYSREYGTLRPRLSNGLFLTPFNPLQGANFEPVPGFHEGNAWQYTFFVPHDVQGLAQLMGGRKAFVASLQRLFDNGWYDPTNEPDLAYPYLFSHFKGEEWRTQHLVRQLLQRHYTPLPNGLPGNDDAGTLSAWAVWSMLGLYCDDPTSPTYTVTAPAFSRIILHLNPKYHGCERLVIEGAPRNENEYIKAIYLGGKRLRSHRISHSELLHGGVLRFEYE